MIRDTQRSARCVIKLASVLRKRAVSDLGRKIIGHSLIGAGGGLAIGSAIGKDSNSPVIGSGLGAVVGGVGGATEYYVQKAREAKKLLEADKMKKEVAELSKRFGLNPSAFDGLSRDEIIEALKQGMKGNNNGVA